MTTNNDLNGLLSNKLRDLKASKKEGGISFDDISGILVDVINGMKGGVLENVEIYAELEAIRDAIDEAKGETTTILNDDGKTIPDAGLQLDAVIKASEDAANDIIDAACLIMELAPENAEINAQAMKIIEKCDFGDLSRQRLIKVVSHLQNIETRLTKLFEALKMEKKAPAEKTCEDGSSLSGPQLSADAPSQDDIDALFNSF